MTIRYTNTRGDIIAAYIHMLLRRRFWLIAVALMSGMIVYANLQSPTLHDQGIGMTLAVGFVMIAMVVMAYGALMVGLIAARVLLSKDRGVLGEHRLTISDEGLTEATAYNESLNRWAGYRRTVSTKGYLLLYVTEGQAHVVPKRRPLLEGDLVAFEALLREKAKTKGE